MTLFKKAARHLQYDILAEMELCLNGKHLLKKSKSAKAGKLKTGTDIAILTLGPVGNYVTDAYSILEKEGIDVAHYDMRFVKPLDEAMLHEIFTLHDRVITVEDGCLQGGFGSAVLEFMIDNGYNSRVKRLGIPDALVEHGEPAELHHECGFDTEGIIDAIRSLMHTGAAVSF